MTATGSKGDSLKLPNKMSHTSASSLYLLYRSLDCWVYNTVLLDYTDIRIWLKYSSVEFKIMYTP